jgi:hypothetical protein
LTARLQGSRFARLKGSRSETSGARAFQASEGTTPGARAFQASVAALALVFLALHLPYLPQSLEDLDSINFALGIRHFDVAQHQPHPPGYPVFIAIAKAIHALGASELTALAILSVASGVVGIVALALLFTALERTRDPRRWLPPALIAMTAPLYWFTAVRPLSDMAGLAAVLAVQVATIEARTPTAFAAAAFAAGVAAGIRSQVVWLTVPLLIVTGLGARGWGLAANTEIGARSSGTAVGTPRRRLAPGPQPLVAAGAAFIAGLLVWFIPLVVVSGGPAAYWRALTNQGAEDFGNIAMLWTRRDLRTLVDALYFAFVAPWATWPVAVVVLGLAVLGTVWLWRVNRAALAIVAVGFAPYFVFDILFHEAFTTRYALPLVVPMAYLAMAGARWLPRNGAVVAAVLLAGFDAHIGGTSIAVFARQKTPAFRLLDDMASAPQSTTAPPVLAMDRRNAFDFRRPVVWSDGALPQFERTLPAPPQHEWLEAMRYWNSGGRAPVWFVVDPKRSSIDLVQHGEPARYRWPLPYPVLAGGSRPDEMDWYRVEQPEWYVGEGWALTPEAAGVAAVDKRGLAFSPIHAGVSRTAVSNGTLMIGGRSFDPTIRPRMIVTLDGRTVADESLVPGAFLRFVRLPFMDFVPLTGAYSALTVTTIPAAPVAIEQFDASATRILAGFGEGWHEQEFNPATGLRWRWLSERGELTVAGPLVNVPAGAERIGPAPNVTLHLAGESPRKYFSHGSRLLVRARDRVVYDHVLEDDFSIDIPIGEAPAAIVLETDQIYVPADRSRRTQDRRHLGLRIFTAQIR